MQAPDLALRDKVYFANCELPKANLVLFTWGNVSGVDRARGSFWIKPSGVAYEKLTPEDMVEVSLETGEILTGSLRPSSDTETHRALYLAWESLGGICHTHSRWATVFAQAGMPVRPLGTTHGDYFYGPVPVTRELHREELTGAPGHYEWETGQVILETYRQQALSPDCLPGCLVRNHGPFTWGKDPAAAVEMAVILEELSFMAWHTLALSPSVADMPSALLDTHYLRKHGAAAYYGQPGKK